MEIIMIITTDWKKKLRVLDARRDLIIPGNHEETIEFSIKFFVELANEAIAQHGTFAVALSGGSTPNAIYKGLTRPEYNNAVDWSRVLCFWGDERCVPPTHPDSNFHMAMEAGLSQLPLLPENIFPMKGTGDLEKNAENYEKLLIEKLPGKAFDLVMLGMGEDGHTASLFPKTHGLHAENRLVVPNFLPQKEIWRMTLTFECINAARHIAFYSMGINKAPMVKQVLTGTYEPDNLPAQRVGTSAHKAIWVLDKDAASFLL
jgi:6-phosphogluconolactonase